MRPQSSCRTTGWAPAARAAEGLRTSSRDHPTSRERVVETGERGEGGDRTLVIDAAAEDAVFGELERLYTPGRALHRGLGGARLRRLRRPGRSRRHRPDRRLDERQARPARTTRSRSRSPTARRWPTSSSATSSTSAPGRSGARRGASAPSSTTRRCPRRSPSAGAATGELELVGDRVGRSRAGWPRRATRSCSVTGRVRAIGSIAVSLCQVAATRVDGMATLWNCRAVDAAAAQLVVRESGGVVAFTATDEPLAAPLDLQPRSPVVAARTDDALAELAHAPGDLMVDWRLAERVGGCGGRRRRRQAAAGRRRRPRRDGAAARASASPTTPGCSPRSSRLPPEAVGRARVVAGQPRDDARHARPARRAPAGQGRSQSRARGDAHRRARRAGSSGFMGRSRARPVRARAARSQRPRAAAARRPQPPRGGPHVRGRRAASCWTWVVFHEVTHAVQFTGGAVAARAPRAGCCASCSTR